MCSRFDDPSMTDQSAVDTLRAALNKIRGEMQRREKPDYYLGFEVVRGILDNMEEALAASATDEAEERRVVRDSEWTPLRKDVRPAVPPLDATLLWDAVTSEGFDIGPTDCERIAARYAALAASATEGPTRLDVALDNYGAGFRDGSARPAVHALDVELGAPFWCYQHDRFCQYPIGPHRPAGPLRRPTDDR